MKAAELYFEAARRGLQLEKRGNKLAVIPSELLDPDFKKTLLAHKAELMAWLEGWAATKLTSDYLPWFHVARQVNEGEFDGASGSVIASVRIGLRSIEHPICQSALARLKYF